MVKISKEKYIGLQMSKEAFWLLKYDIERFKKYCNGVGSKVGWLGKLSYHLLPNTIWFLNITPASDIHDVEYSYPTEFLSKDKALSFKRKADYRFFTNMNYLIKKQNSFKWIEKMRLNRARIYYFFVSKYGKESFLAHKKFLED